MRGIFRKFLFVLAIVLIIGPFATDFIGGWPFDFDPIFSIIVGVGIFILWMILWNIAKTREYNSMASRERRKFYNNP